MEGAQDVGDHADAQRRGGAHPHTAALQPDQLGHGGACRLHVGEHAPRQREDGHSGGSEDQRVPAALYQG